MPIPDYQTLMLPLLRLAGDGEEHAMREAIESLADEFGLDDRERNELQPSGQQALFDNRVGWARTYLKKAGLLESTRRGFIRITQRGKEVLADSPPSLGDEYLKRFPEFAEFKVGRPGPPDAAGEVAAAEERTPEEQIELANQKLRWDLAAELLQRVKSCSPAFFERLVVDLLVRMGYGGTRRDAGQAVGRSGDGGIDGIIKEDRLGLDIIYIQAKRWEGTVSRPEIQKFAGALDGQRARKGIFITTSAFTRDALEYARTIDKKIILVDGEMLSQLMIDFDVAVSTAGTYVIKKIDHDYFSDE